MSSMDDHLRVHKEYEAWIKGKTPWGMRPKEEPVGYVHEHFPLSISVVLEAGDLMWDTQQNQYVRVATVTKTKKGNLVTFEKRSTQHKADPEFYARYHRVSQVRLPTLPKNPLGFDSWAALTAKDKLGEQIERQIDSALKHHDITMHSAFVPWCAILALLVAVGSVVAGLLGYYS